MSGPPAEIEAAEQAGQAAKAEQLRKAKRGEIIRKLRSLRQQGSPVKKAPKRAAAAQFGGSTAVDDSKPGRAEVGEADVARIISAWSGAYVCVCVLCYLGTTCLTCFASLA